MVTPLRVMIRKVNGYTVEIHYFRTFRTFRILRCPGGNEDHIPHEAMMHLKEVIFC